MNTKDIQTIIDSNDNFKICQIINNYSLPMFQINRIINNKNLTQKTRKLAKQEKIERIKSEMLCEIGFLD